MANDINWKSIIEKVFAEYGSQLRRAKVSLCASTSRGDENEPSPDLSAMFAGEEIRCQGCKAARAKRGETGPQDIPETVLELRQVSLDIVRDWTLSSAPLSAESTKVLFLACSGKKAVQDNGGMLSLEGSAPSAQPAAVKFSLLDLAEAADKMSQEQLSLATGAKQSKQTAKKSLTGPQEARKRKAKDMTNSHDAEPSGGPSMLTRTQLRQQGSNLYEAAAAADAAATPTFSPSAAPVNTRTSKPSSDAEQMSQAQHTATLLPNGEVLRHLPVSERGKNESGAAHGGANRQQQPAAGAADNTGGVSSQAAPHFTQKGLKDEMQASKPKKGKLQDGISAVATLVADKALAVADSSAGEPQPSTSAAEPHEQAAKVSTAAAPAEAFAKKSKAKQTRQDNGLAASAEPLSPTAAADYTGQAHRDTAAAVDTASGIDAAQHPGQKHKKRKQDKKDMQDAAPATDAQTVGPAAVGQSEPTEDVHAITVGTEPATAASAAQQQNGAEVPAGKVKKRKHKSKEERVSAGLDNLLKSSAVEASAVPPVQADVSAGASKQKNKAAEPKQEKRSKDKKRAASEIADQGNAVADRIATGLSSHAVPTEAAVRAEPAVPDEPAELVRKSKKQRRKDKPEPQPDTNNQPLSPAAEQPGTIHITAPASATDVEPASDGTEKPAAKAKRARKAKASAGADSTQDPPASAAPEQPAAKAKPGRKSKAAAGSESADTEAAASPGKATRGRPPKSATAAQGAAASGSGLVTASWREGDMYSEAVCTCFAVPGYCRVEQHGHRHS